MAAEGIIAFWISAGVMGLFGFIGLIMLILGIVFIVKNAKAIKRKKAEQLSTTGNIIWIAVLSVMSFVGLAWSIVFTIGAILFLITGTAFTL